jgi:hemoglobin
MKKKDIVNRKDIESLVDHFYEKVKIDAQLGPIFTEIARVDWDKHLPRMYEFWENIAFQTGQYTGNPMTAHYRIHAIRPFTTADFNRWLALFGETLDEHFEGDRTELIRQRALSIATVMQIKILHTPQEDQPAF